MGHGGVKYGARAFRSARVPRSPKARDRGHPQPTFYFECGLCGGGAEFRVDWDEVVCGDGAIFSGVFCVVEGFIGGFNEDLRAGAALRSHGGVAE